MGNGDNLESLFIDLKAGRGWFDQMISRIEALMNEGKNGALNIPDTGDETSSPNGMNAEVRTFIQPLIGRMTSSQIALALADRFPLVTMAQIEQWKQPDGKGASFSLGVGRIDWNVTPAKKPDPKP